MFTSIAVSLLLVQFILCFNLFKNVGTNSHLPVDILHQFENYTRIIYYDYSALEYVKEIFTETKESMAITVLKNVDEANYKTLTTKYFKQLYVIFLSTNVRNVAIEIFKLIKSQDVLFFFSDSIEQSICQSRLYPETQAVFIFDTTNGQLFYCHYFKNKIRGSLEEVLKSKGKYPKLFDLFNNFTDLGGYTFQIGCSNFVPLFFWNTLSKEMIVRGPEYNLLVTLSKKLNFTYRLDVYGSNTTITNISVKDQMLPEIIANKLDFTVAGTSVSYARWMVIEYMADIFEDNYYIVFGANNKFPFSITNKNMVGCIIPIVCLALIAKISTKIFNQEQRSFIEDLQIFANFLLNQSLSDYQKKYVSKWKSSIKIIFLVWALISVILVTAFQVGLTSNFIAPDGNEPTSVNDLVQMGFSIESNLGDNKFIKSWCKYAEALICNYTQEIIVNPNRCNSFRRMFYSRTAIFIEGMPFKHVVGSNDCGKYGITKIRKMLAGMGADKQSWMFKKETPYIQAFSNLVNRLKENGLMFYWFSQEDSTFDRYTSSKKVADKRSSSETIRLKLENSLQAFIFLICGHLISTIVFIAEIFKFHSDRKN